MTVLHTDLKRFGRYATSLLLGALLLTSCGDDDDIEKPIGPPQPVATGNYEFGRNETSTVDYSGQKARIAMLDEVLTYIKTAHESTGTPGQITAAKLKDMFANTNNAFTNATLNISGKDIKSKMESGRAAYYETIFDAAGQASTRLDSTAQQGKAGRLLRGVNADGSNRYILVDANGQEFKEIIEKGIFIESFFWQATDNYLSADKMLSADNMQLLSGKNYTEMEHYWDEAFGYSSMPIVYSTLGGYELNAEYIMARNDIGYELARRIHNAFELGRKNISDQLGAASPNFAVRDAQIRVIKEEWETALAASAVSYMNKVQVIIAATSGPDLASKLHMLSEVKGFMNFMRHSDRFTATETQAIMDMIGEDLWAVDAQGIIAAKTAIAAKYPAIDKDYK